MLIHNPLKCKNNLQDIKALDDESLRESNAQTNTQKHATTPMIELIQIGHSKCIEVTKETKIYEENLIVPPLHLGYWKNFHKPI